MPWKVINENKRGGRRETLEGVRIRSRWFGSIKDGMELGKLETSVKFQQAFPPEKREKFGYWINLWKILFSTRAPLLLHTGPRKTYHLFRNFPLGSILLLYHLIKTFLPKRVYERDSRSNKTFETEIYFTATVNRAGKKERKRRNFLFLNLTYSLSKGKSLIYISKKLSIYPEQYVPWLYLRPRTPWTYYPASCPRSPRYPVKENREKKRKKKRGKRRENYSREFRYSST